jgi:RNase P subunit RPR2
MGINNFFKIVLYNMLTEYWHILAIIISIIILSIVIKIFKPRIKGFFGEKSIAFFLSRLDSNKYKVINNLMINVNGKTVQIDNLIISNFGIFVIETKNYKGFITGNKYNDYWTQTIYKYKEKFYNPIKQNYGHTQALKTILKEFQNIVYYPIVVFTTEADLKVTADTDVVYDTHLIRTIKKYQKENISDVTRDKIYAYLNTKNVTDKNLKKEHIQNIQEKKIDVENKIKSDICPKCGSSLVIRNGKYGTFKGCSNYPKCRFTINI